MDNGAATLTFAPDATKGHYVAYSELPKRRAVKNLFILKNYLKNKKLSVSLNHSIYAC